MSEEHSEEMKRMTEHITNLISEIAILNIEINIKSKQHSVGRII